MEYIKLCKEQNITPQLNEIEKNIVNKDGMFVEIFSSYNNVNALFWPYDLDSEEEMSKSEYYTIYPKIKNVCAEYIAMLNKLPDNNLTKCSRYANEENSLFEFIRYNNVPDEYKKIVMADEYGRRGGFFIKYKDEYFLDINFHAFILPNEFKNNLNYNLGKHCEYVYVDFNLKEQINIYGGKCRGIENYDQIYKNVKE
jgi:hypothetical protein